MPVGWHFLVGDLTQPLVLPGGAGSVQFAAGPPRGPLTVESLSVRFISRVSANSGGMQIDDLQTSAQPPTIGSAPNERLLFDPARTARPFANAQVVASFDDAGGWEPLRGMNAQGMNDEVRDGSAQAGTFLRLSWRPVPGQPITHGITVAGSQRPLRVLASEAFIEATGIAVGSGGMAFVGNAFMDIEVAGTFRLFPTLADPRSEPALVTDRDALLATMNRVPRGSTSYAGELWINGGEEAAARIGALQAEGRLIGQVVSLQAIRDAQESDPLVAAGWEGILFISFASILILSTLGFLIYSYLTAQKRTLEFAVLRTMGFSRRQIATVVGFEQAFIIGLGMAAGTVMGLRLGGLMIRYMGVTETGDRALPPMVLQVSWLTIGSTWLVLGLAFVTTIAVVVLLYSRLALHRVLRIGEA
jgi:hypothetical protein